jgi:hypothetical protein
VGIAVEVGLGDELIGVVWGGIDVDIGGALETGIWS